MPVTIGSNISAIRTIRALDGSSNELATTFERLSSGQRINRASDDAAGLAISESLNAVSRVYAQGIRNLADAVSLQNIRDGAIAELVNVVTRQRELATQAANGVYSDIQRRALDLEAQALSAEYNRVVATTKFNGIGLLDGSTTTTRIQAGYGLDQSLELNLAAGTVTTVEGTGVFGAASSVGSTYQRNTVIADLNGDGRADLFSADAGADTVNYFFGNGDGTFQAGISISTGAGTSPVNITGGDFDGDGDVDMVTSLLNPRDIVVHLNNGNGTFATGVTYDAQIFSPIGIVAGDLDEDGALDLFVGGGGGGGFNTAIFFGNGNGTFEPVDLFNDAAQEPKVVAMADINGNGHLDLVAAAALDDRVWVYLDNGGNGTFQAGISMFGGNFINTDPEPGLAFADLNGDSRLDLITTSVSDDRLNVFFGNGNGTFATRVSYTVGTDPSAVVARDVDGDGDADLVTSAWDERISVFKNNGDGTFASRVSYSISGLDPYSLTMGDVNGDGVADIVTADDTGLSILLAQTTSSTSPGGLIAAEFSIRTQSQARAAIDTLGTALDDLTQQRGRIGAEMSRIDVAIRTLGTARENFASARSRIVDADIASESSKLVRASILQQAGTAVLAQARVQPQLALQLLAI